MERRRFLELALALGAGGGVLSLAGCGGGKSSFTTSGSNGGGRTRQVRGTVVVPAGFSLPLATMTAAAGLGHSAVGADGAFTVPVNAANNAGPTLVWLQNADDVLLIGFGGESGSSTMTLSAESTAIALVYFALGGFSIPAENRGQLLALIAGDSSLPPFVQTVTAQIGVNPLALVQGDQAIGTALRAVLTAMGATASLDANISGRSVKTLAAAPTRSRAVDAQLLLSPTGLQSNLEVLLGNAAQTVVATNHSRRYCRVHTYQTGVENASGIRTDYPAAKAVGGPVVLTSTGALSILSTIHDFTSGQTAFVPVSTPEIPLAVEGDAAQTFYDIVVLGSALSLADPAFYADPKYAAFVAGWRSERIRLNLTSWLSDIILGLLFEIWGLRDIAKNEAAIEAMVTAFQESEVAIAGAAFLLAAGEGRFAKATGDFLGILSSRPEIAVRLRAILANVLLGVR